MQPALLAWYAENGRDLPWRHTRDPYAILVSEVMLQQTQAGRVVPRYLAWLERWPAAAALAEAPTADVLREWQGLGYNRRALNLRRAALHRRGSRLLCVRTAGAALRRERAACARANRRELRARVRAGADGSRR